MKSAIFLTPSKGNEPDVQGFALGVAASILQAIMKVSECFLMRSLPSGVKGDWVPSKPRC